MTKKINPKRTLQYHIMIAQGISPENAIARILQNRANNKIIEIIEKQKIDMAYKNYMGLPGGLNSIRNN
jgi:hypothetical protein